MLKSNNPIAFRLVASAKRAIGPAVMVAVFFAGAQARAGRPLVTEDAGVLDQGGCETESYIGRYHQPGLTLRWAQLGCGAGLNTQVNVGAGIEKTGAGHVSITALSGKTALRQLTDEQAGIAIAYGALAGKHVDSLRHEATEIKLALTVPHNDWLVHANLGMLRTRSSHSSQTIWALALERRGAIGPIDLMGEICGDDRVPPLAQLAARWTVIPERLFVDTSLGAQINDVQKRQATIGLKLAF